MSEKQYISENAQLMAEWNWERNTNFDPSQLTIGSGKKVWWVCSRGHEWQATVDHRTNGRGCPICLTDRRSSYPEQAIFYYVKIITMQKLLMIKKHIPR